MGLNKSLIFVRAIQNSPFFKTFELILFGFSVTDVRALRNVRIFFLRFLTKYFLKKFGKSKISRIFAISK